MKALRKRKSLYIPCTLGYRWEGKNFCVVFTSRHLTQQNIDRGPILIVRAVASSNVYTSITQVQIIDQHISGLCFVLISAYVRLSNGDL